jgi:hypothetical protein
VTGTTAWTPEEKRSALERALQSRTFERSDQLRAFLRFVCEAEIQGSGADLTEYRIGVEVLHRPQGYSPSEDSSVRTRAYELRHKLEKLYALDLTNEPIQIVLPKGSYAPQYIRGPISRSAEARPVDLAPEHSAPVAVEPAGRTRSVVLAGVLVGVIAGAALTLGSMVLTRKSPVDPILLEAWRPLSGQSAQVLLCIATPLDLTLGPESHQAYGSPTYPAPPEAYPMFRQHRPLAPDAKLGMIFTDNLVGVGTLNAVVISANTLRNLDASYQILPEKVATIEALHGRNAILFGAPVDSAVISQVLHDTPLTVDYEPSVREFVIRDRTNSRMIVPSKDDNGDFVDVYGLVTVINTRDSDRGRLGTVVFSGITSAGTHGAAEYFASARSLRDLRAIFAREGIRGFPVAYQVVVKCKFSRMLLVSYEYHSHRILQKE